MRSVPSVEAKAPPLVAILRGLTPERASAVGATLRGAGIRIIEVPLNSPDPYRSIATLATESGADCLLGAGTVLTLEQVERTHAAGGRLVVSPNTNPAVIRAALERGMQVLPGFATASEAFAALDAGARMLKLFPAATYGPGHLRALREVLPADTQIYPVGGIGAADVAPWLEAGAAGFGFGSELFKPQFTLEEIAARAARAVAALAPRPSSQT
jgi:2-dehydro-3-deoxyphosphogalactonate aldolase